MGKILSAFVQTKTPFFTKVKSEDETIATDIVISADSELKFEARANQTYHIRLFIHAIASGATPDLDNNLIIPALATAVKNDGAWDSNVLGTTSDWELEVTEALTTNEVAMEISGIVRMGATAGEVAFGWAQNISSAQTLTILSGSFMEAYES